MLSPWGAAALSAAGLVWLALLMAGTEPALCRMGLLRRNFQGRPIPVGIGLVVLLWALPALGVLAVLAPAGIRATTAFAAVILAFGLLGLADDLWGDRRATGLRGHVGELLRHGRVTTGLLKLVGGALAATLVPRLILDRTWPAALLEGALIALSANLLNLLDLRPGRCAAVFLVLGSLASLADAFARGGVRLPPLLLVLVPALAVYPRDARGQAMLGDVGSNLLGAALGLALALAIRAPAGELALVAVLGAVHVAAERWSLTALIERAPALRALDRLTGIRGDSASE